MKNQIANGAIICCVGFIVYLGGMYTNLYLIAAIGFILCCVALRIWENCDGIK